MLSKRGQITSVYVFVAVTIGIILLGPFILKMVVTPLNAFSSAVRPISSDSADAVDYGVTKFTTFWDMILVLAFFFNIILLFVTSFLVDIHPALVFVYIIGVVLLFFFAPNYLQAVNEIYTSPAFATEVTYLPQMTWIYGNYGFILLGVVAVTGIIMFGKFAFGGGQTGRGVGAYAK